MKKIRQCGKPATMRVYEPGGRSGPGKTMCTRHGQMLAEDAGRTYSTLRPSDPPATCEFWEAS